MWTLVAFLVERLVVSLPDISLAGAGHFWRLGAAGGASSGSSFLRFISWLSLALSWVTIRQVWTQMTRGHLALYLG